MYSFSSYIFYMNIFIVCDIYISRAIQMQVKDNEDEIIAKIVKKSYHNGEELIGVENKLHIECEYQTSTVRH